MTTTLFGNLAGDLTGEPGRRPPLVLLHGLTFDRTSWHPVPGRADHARPGTAGPRAGPARPRRVPALAGLRPGAQRRRGPPGHRRSGAARAGAGRALGRRPGRPAAA